MKKILTIVTLILLILYSGFLVFIFYMENDTFMTKLSLWLLGLVGVFLLRHLYKKREVHYLKSLVASLLVYFSLLSFGFTQRVYTLMTGVYIDGTSIISVNGKRAGEERSKKLKELFLNLEEYNTTISHFEPTYSLSYAGVDDPDYLHLHIFKEDRLVVEGCLLGVEKGDRLEGYLLSNELLKVLEEM